jgi:sugar phosphate isomerase/epimerase
MRLAGRPELGHLTYCTNIHPGESWAEVSANLERYLPAVKREVAPDRALGVGLRLSAIAAEALRAPAALAELKGFLADHDLYVFTINGFPYGPFHGRPVKEQVYQPDWQDEARVTYSDGLADLLAELLPDDPALEGSISTVPGTFKPLAEAPGAVEQMARNMVRHAAHLAGIRARTGRTLALALEPEPYCFLETIDETVGFFERHLFGAAAVRLMSELTGLAPGAAEAALRRHLGVCYDVCHAAVEFEDPAGSLQALRAAGIGVPKLQLSAALRIAAVGPETAAQLRPFDEPVYLHQVIARQDGRLIRYLDLPQALAALAQNRGAEWRVHFHVPIFLAQLRDFSTTQAFLGEILARHRREPISANLEVETYTWDVLPERYRQVDVASAVARELAWVVEQLEA